MTYRLVGGAWLLDTHPPASISCIPPSQGTEDGKCREGTDNACFFALDGFLRERPCGISAVGKLITAFLCVNKVILFDSQNTSGKQDRYY